MRSLPSIIKASQYGDIKGNCILTANPADLLKPPADGTTKHEAREQHQAIVNDAFQKAKNIVDAAQNYSLNQLRESTVRMNEECAQMKIRSYEDGYSQGFEEGKKEGRELGYEDGCRQGLKKAEEETREAGRQTRDELKQMLDAVENKKSEVLTKFEADLESLAVAIAKKVIQKELSTDEKTMQAIIYGVLENYRDQAWVKILVSPQTAELLTKADRSIIEALQQVSSNVKILPSPEMNDGDCQIDLPDRLIDAGVDTQLTQIKTALQL